MRSRGVWASVHSLLLPRVCEACGDRANAASGLCSPCRRALTPGRAAHVLPPDDLTVIAPFRYDGEVGRALMRRFKFGGSRSLAIWMARTMAPALRRWGGLPTDAVFCPVPLAPHRRRERGYNQAELLATALSERMAHPSRRLLRRREARGRQTDRGKGERERALESAFAPEPTSAYLPVVIVDDVCTTGSTLKSCRRVLEANGHHVVCAATVFFTPLPGSGICSAKSSSVRSRSRRASRSSKTAT